MNEVSDLNRESIIQRVIRDNAMAALMVVLALVTMINGLIIGVCIAVMFNTSNELEDIKRIGEMNLAWDSRLMIVIEKAGIEVPPHPQIEKEG